MIPQAHLPQSAASKRSLTTGRAFRLNEPDMPRTSPGTNPVPPWLLDEWIAHQITIVRYLDVEHSPRYQPTATQTFCNCYAVDYCYLNGVYLPRVWWSPAAITSMDLGKPAPAVEYGKTVFELNANSLFDWLNAFGPQYGWSKVQSLDKLQEAANQGHVGVICAAQAMPSRSGHISLVVPESDAPNVAVRAAGEVTIPLQSQAGVHNRCFSCAEGVWWKASYYRGFGFFVNALEV